MKNDKRQNLLKHQMSPEISQYLFDLIWFCLSLHLKNFIIRTDILYHVALGPQLLSQQAFFDDSNPHCQHHLYQKNQWWHAHLNCDPGRGSYRTDRKEHLLPPPAPPASSFFWAMGEEEAIWWRGGGWGRDGGGARCFPWGCLLERGDPACRSMTCEGDIMKCEWLSL